MSNYEVKITVDNIDKIKSELSSRIPVILEAIGIEAEGNAIDEVNKLVYDTPESPSYVRTGRLKNSITHAVDDADQSVYVGTNLEYAPYVEYGTRNMKERPFLRNAANDYKDDYKRIVEDGLK